MIPLSVLDLAPIIEGGTAAQAFANSLDLAQHAERWGYRRFWLAEHHSMPGVASAATSIVIAHVAAGTKTIRVGAGGIMLPNHSPLVIAEQFGTLASLFPGRIDLGVGRAPGSDQLTSRALRRSPAAADTFPQDVVELISYFQPVQPGQLVRAVQRDERRHRDEAAIALGKTGPLPNLTEEHLLREPVERRGNVGERSGGRRGLGRVVAGHGRTRVAGCDACRSLREQSIRRGIPDLLDSAA